MRQEQFKPGGAICVGGHDSDQGTEDGTIEVTGSSGERGCMWKHM
jgi:hypothetical protein